MRPTPLESADARVTRLAADTSMLLRGGRLPLWVRVLLRAGVRPFLIAGDVAALLLSALATQDLSGRVGVMLGFVVLLNAAGGLYTSRLTLSALDDLPSLVGRALAAAALTTTVGLLLDARTTGRGVLATAGVFVVAEVAVRALAYATVRTVRRRKVIAHTTLIIGAGQIGGQIARLMLEHPEYGLLPVGFVDNEPWLPPDERPVPVLGGLEQLAERITEFGVTQVIVAFGAVRESNMIDILRTCDRLSCEMFFIPRLFEVHAISRDMDQLWGMPLVRMRRPTFRTLSWRVKRAVDVLLASALIVLTAPVLAAVAMAVRLEGGPGILFRQHRVGLDGRGFDILKFRSMKAAPDESATQWSIATDSRVGPVGRFIRRTSLDELPQLFNVLRGDMSLVGPRPERPHFVEQFQATFPRYMARHRVPAGLTGWAQVHGLRGDTSIEERARFDNFYIENWSLWVDIKLMLRTVGSILRRTGS